MVIVAVSTLMPNAPPRYWTGTAWTLVNAKAKQFTYVHKAQDAIKAMGLREGFEERHYIEFCVR